MRTVITFRRGQTFHESEFPDVWPVIHSKRRQFDLVDLHGVIHESFDFSEVQNVIFVPDESPAERDR